MDIDQVFGLVGEMGPQQVLYYVYMTFLGAVFVSGQMLQIIFTGAAPEFTCTSGSTVLNNTCSSNNSVHTCDTIQYSPKINSIAVEWNLVCRDSYKVKMVQAVFMSGVMIGAFTFGYLSDAFGRKKTLMIATLSVISLSFLGAAAPSFVIYTAIRFFAGLTTAAVGLISFVLVTELVGATKRAACGTFFQAFFAVAIALHCLVAYYIPFWRYYTIVTTLFGVLCVPLLWLTPESPRWLSLHGEKVKAKMILFNIAVKNNTINYLPKYWDIQEPSIQTEKCDIASFITHPILRKQTLIQLFSWFINGATYYGLTLSANSLGGDLYVSTALSGLVEVPGYVITVFILNYFGRRYSLCGTMLFGGLACGIIQILDAGTRAGPIGQALLLTGKMGVSMSFAIVFVYSAELFPTSVRNVGMGIVAVATRFGGILSPFIGLLDQIAPAFQFTTLGILMIVSGLMSLCLPETLNKALPETVDDIRDVNDDSFEKYEPMDDAITQKNLYSKQDALFPEEKTYLILKTGA